MRPRSCGCLLCVLESPDLPCVAKPSAHDSFSRGCRIVRVPPYHPVASANQEPSLLLNLKIDFSFLVSFKMSSFLLGCHDFQFCFLAFVLYKNGAQSMPLDGCGQEGRWFCTRVPDQGGTGPGSALQVMSSQGRAASASSRLPTSCL